MTQQQKAVLFDIGNVFVEFDPRNLYRKLIDDPAELDHFLSEVLTLDWVLETDRGTLFDDATRTLVARFPEYEEWITAYDARWPETLGAAIDGTMRLLERLSEQGVPAYGLTNFSAEKWPVFCRLYDFTDLFEGVVVSGEEKLVKPDPRIFHVAMDRFGLDPEDTFYTDDRIENVRAAEQLGMIGNHFTGAGQLEAHLRQLGYLA